MSLDVFLWEFMKNTIHQEKVHGNTVGHMKQSMLELGKKFNIILNVRKEEVNKWAVWTNNVNLDSSVTIPCILYT